MSIDWDKYEIYNPGVNGLLNMLPCSEARWAFGRLMEVKPQRVDMLCNLLSANGISLTSVNTAIQDLNDWFRINVEADVGKPGRLRPIWYSVVNDIALFLGDVMIERCPGLHWEFYTWARKSASYQRPVIVGFTQVADPKYNIDIDGAVAAYGRRIVVSRGSVPNRGRVTIRGVEIDIDAIATRQDLLEIETDAFCQWIGLAEKRA